MMESGPVFRNTSEADWPDLCALYGAAFPQEDLMPLLSALLNEPSGVLSLAACRDGAIQGHAIFTTCGVSGTDRKAGLVGPVAVNPNAQRQGIGKALIARGLEIVRGVGVEKALVLGDPAYYGRLGFRMEEGVPTPYPIPPEWQGAWQSMDFTDESAAMSGTLMVPAPWRNPALWA